MSKPHSKPRTEHASDLWRADYLEEHFSGPRALVGRVECAAAGRDDEPVEQSGELAVLTNVPGQLSIELAFAYPFKDFDAGHRRTLLGRATLEPSATRALARYLWESADRAESSADEVRACLECGDLMGDDDLYDDHHIFMGQRLHQVRCECGVSGPACLTKDGAIARWNGMMAVTPDCVDAGSVSMDDWREGGDVGESALALYRALRLGRQLVGLTPADPADLGRCIRMLDLADSIGLAWRSRLSSLQAADHWRPFIAAWEELERLYIAESPRGDGPRIRARLRELSGMVTP